jgi:hypothetical protein
MSDDSVPGLEVGRLTLVTYLDADGVARWRFRMTGSMSLAQVLGYLDLCRDQAKAQFGWKAET